MENNDWLEWLILRDKTEINILDETHKQLRRNLQQSISMHEMMKTKLELLTKINKEVLENEVLRDKIAELEKKLERPVNNIEITKGNNSTFQAKYDGLVYYGESVQEAIGLLVFSEQETMARNGIEIVFVEGNDDAKEKTYTAPLKG